jgi:hypothetical protein
MISRGFQASAGLATSEKLFRVAAGTENSPAEPRTEAGAGSMN